MAFNLPSVEEVYFEGGVLTITGISVNVVFITGPFSAPSCHLQTVEL
jgi:hypothetical protein